jgi:flavin reductase (DIM6/NTAB) family NADH-FMN oxidoreductase RutF
MPISGDLYKKLGRSAAGPVCIIAAYDRMSDVIVGLTASSFVTLSFEPPLVMFAVQQKADSYASIVSSKVFGVSLLDRAQSELATLFARKGRDKIETTSFARGHILHCPLIPGALAHIECATSQILLSGDHAIVVGLVEAALTREGEPLLYFGGKFGTFAQEPTPNPVPAPKSV